MRIEILGTGCAKCRKLEENARKAVESLGLECEVMKVGDLNRIAAYGVFMTPGLVLDGEVKSSGKVLSPEEIAGLIEQAR